MTANPHGVMQAARQVQQMAKGERQQQMSFALTVISVALVAIMALREFREMSKVKEGEQRGRWRD